VRLSWPASFGSGGGFGSCSEKKGNTRRECWDGKQYPALLTCGGCEGGPVTPGVRVYERVGASGSAGTKPTDPGGSRPLCEPTTGAGARRGRYCDRCAALGGLDGLHVLAVERGEERLTVTVETSPRRGGWPAHWRWRPATAGGRWPWSTPCFGWPDRVVWRKRTWRCAESNCPPRVCTDAHPEFEDATAVLDALHVGSTGSRLGCRPRRAIGTVVNAPAAS
jgi:hypothetical protein